jgi:hypothetical protein
MKSGINTWGMSKRLTLLAKILHIGSRKGVSSSIASLWSVVNQFSALVVKYETRILTHTLVSRDILSETFQDTKTLVSYTHCSTHVHWHFHTHSPSPNESHPQALNGAATLFPHWWVSMDGFFMAAMRMFVSFLCSTRNRLTSERNCRQLRWNLIVIPVSFFTRYFSLLIAHDSHIIRWNGIGFQ